jgi:hypothetical protein
MSKKPLPIEVGDYNNDIDNLIKNYFPIDIKINNEEIKQEQNIQDFALYIYKKLKLDNNKLELDNKNSTIPTIPTSTTPTTANLKSTDTTIFSFSPEKHNDIITIEKKPGNNNIKIQSIGEKHIDIKRIELTTDKTTFFTKSIIIPLNSDFYNFTCLSIISEIVLHYYAIYLNKKICINEIKIPEILEINKKSITEINKKTEKQDEYDVISIKMEYLDIIDFKKEENKHIKNQIINKFESWNIPITKLFTCFEEHKLYHNDTHSDNLVFINTEEGTKLALIDFGKATLNNAYSVTSTGYPRLLSNQSNDNQEQKQKQKQIFANLLDRNTNKEVVETTNLTRYGGKTNKTKRKKTKKRKNKKRKTSKKPKY